MDMAKNDAVFGKCNNPNFHGTTTRCGSEATGEPDPVTGYDG